MRTELRSRYGLPLDLGDDSPEALGPGDPPIAVWSKADAMPPVSSSEYSYRQGAPVVFASTQRVGDAERVRLGADDFTTVVDEAVLVGDRLFVREGDEVGELDAGTLHEERGAARGMATFVFGKTTKVTFADANDEVVRALRDRFEEVAESASRVSGERRA